MSLHDQHELDLATVFNTVDAARTATTSGGSSVPCLIDYQQVLGQFDLNGQATSATLYLRESDVTSVARYDTFTVSGTAWRVDQILARDGHVWMLQVSTDRRVS